MGFCNSLSDLGYQLVDHLEPVTKKAASIPNTGFSWISSHLGYGCLRTDGHIVWSFSVDFFFVIFAVVTKGS